MEWKDDRGSRKEKEEFRKQQYEDDMIVEDAVLYNMEFEEFNPKDMEFIINEISLGFCVDNKLIITFSDKGIKFHLENFPNYTPDNFAMEFIKILETGFTVKFHTK